MTTNQKVAYAASFLFGYGLVVGFAANVLHFNIYRYGIIALVALAAGGFLATAVSRIVKP